MYSGFFFAYSGVLILYVLIFLLIIGCHSEKQSSAVGRIGTENIYLEDLREFESVAADSSQLSFEQHVDYLKILIDRELLLGEAKDLSLQNNTELQAILSKDAEARLAEIVYTLEIDQRAIPVSYTHLTLPTNREV